MPPGLAVSLALAVTLATTLPVLPAQPTHAIFADFGDIDVMARTQLRPAAGPPHASTSANAPRHGTTPPGPGGTPPRRPSRWRPLLTASRRAFLAGAHVCIIPTRALLAAMRPMMGCEANGLDREVTGVFELAWVDTSAQYESALVYPMPPYTWWRWWGVA